MPKAWRILYKNAQGQFRPVASRGPYGTKKDTFNQVDFGSVTTTAIKLEIDLQDDWAAGIQEVVIGP